MIQQKNLQNSKMIEEFTKTYGTECPEYKKLGNKYYLDNSLPKTTLAPESKGLFLGEEKNKKFVPSFPFLDIISKSTDKKAIINEKAEWMFLCRRDVLAKSVIKIHEEGEVLVLNLLGEVLGIGLTKGKGIKNVLDRGDFLRRER